jgi:molybdopterin synthase catalytic subunit
LVLLTREHLSVETVLPSLRNDVFGGYSLFLGDVRSETDGVATRKLLYEAYEEMALAEMRKVVAEAEARWGGKAALVHRLGELAPGETSVIAAAACPHRAEAFEACRYLIERLKADVPIWKTDL